jgi:hypothetical protein
MSLQI